MAETAVPIPTRVLVLGMAHADGTIDATELFPVAEACGQSPEQVRSCLRRLVAEGLYERHGQGREATYTATEAGLSSLGSFAERQRLAHAQDAAGRGWDRRWHLVAFAIPEADRAARGALRDHLVTLGGAAVHHGLYASAHPWEKAVAARADELGITSRVTIATADHLSVGGSEDPKELAAKLWPIDDLARRYQELCDTYGGVPDALEAMRDRRERLADEEFLPGALAMGVAFQQCFIDDPLLPPELLPRPWPGRTARELAVRSRRLALRLRERSHRPALFATYDDLLASLP